MAWNLIDIIKDKNAHFKQYRNDTLYYETDDGFVFEVPVKDLGGACVNATEKASVFMKWIKKALDQNKD